MGESLYVEIILDYLLIDVPIIDLEKSCCKNSTDTSHRLFTQVPLRLASYTSKPQCNDQNQDTDIDAIPLTKLQAFLEFYQFHH